MLLASFHNRVRSQGALAGKPRARRRATAAVELAVVAPLFALITLGMFELSRGWQVKDLLNDAARKGCRTAILPGKANSDVTADVNNIFTDNSISTTQVTTTILVNGSSVDVNTSKQNDKISVKVAIPVSQVYWDGTIFLTASTIESETVVMMRQS